MTDAEHALVQFMMAQRQASEADVLAAFRQFNRIEESGSLSEEASDSDGDAELDNDLNSDDLAVLKQLLRSSITSVNRNLRAMGYEIRELRDFEYGDRKAVESSSSGVTQAREKPVFFYFVNLSSDTATQFATTYAPDTIQFLKALIAYVFTEANEFTMPSVLTENEELLTSLYWSQRSLGRNLPNLSIKEFRNEFFGIPSTAALNLYHKITAKPKLVAEKSLFPALLDDGWIEYSSKGFYYLSPRTLLELKSYIINEFSTEEQEGEGDGNSSADPVIRLCHGCKNIVTAGIRCFNQGCSTRFHIFCAQTYFSSRRLTDEEASASGRKCPCPNSECFYDFSILGGLSVGSRTKHVNRVDFLSNDGR